MIILKDKKGEILARIPDDKFPIHIHTVGNFFKKFYKLVITAKNKIQLS